MLTYQFQLRVRIDADTPELFMSVLERHLSEMRIDILSGYEPDGINIDSVHHADGKIGILTGSEVVFGGAEAYVYEEDERRRAAATSLSSEPATRFERTHWPIPKTLIWHAHDEDIHHNLAEAFAIADDNAEEGEDQ